MSAPPCRRFCKPPDCAVMGAHLDLPLAGRSPGGSRATSNGASATTGWSDVWEGRMEASGRDAISRSNAVQGEVNITRMSTFRGFCG